MRALEAELKGTDVSVVRTGSLGQDKCEPVVSVERGGKTVFFGGVTHDGARQIAAYAKGGAIASEWVIAEF
jgi:(2Fe-2S) ferredoxin